MEASRSHTLMNRRLVGKLHGLRQEFPEQDPDVMMQLIRMYLLSLYGSQGWDIFSSEANKLWATWHKTIKSLYKLLLATHRYILQNFAKGDHLRLKILKSFMNFYNKISNSANPNIALLHSVQQSDMRSCYARNIRKWTC